VARVRLAWLVYTLFRGEIVDWYPYPFVDVSALGYGGVLARSVGPTLGFAVAALGAALDREPARPAIVVLPPQAGTLTREWSTARNGS
jgi:hypothetical protein